MKRTCKQCGKEFVITQSEINFYKSKNLNIPKRCKECRKSNKARKEVEAAALETTSYQGSEKKKSTPVTKAVTAMLIVVAVIYGIFFNGDPSSTTNVEFQDLEFRTGELLYEHYEKHGVEMGFSSAQEYEEAASDVVESPNAIHKTEAEDGDMVYYIAETNEFVIVSPDGYLRTYFLPEDGIDYYNRQ